MNKGIDGEKEYGYEGANDICWTAAEKRHIASINSFANVLVRAPLPLRRGTVRLDSVSACPPVVATGRQ